MLLLVAWVFSFPGGWSHACCNGRVRGVVAMMLQRVCSDQAQHWCDAGWLHNDSSTHYVVSRSTPGHRRFIVYPPIGRVMFTSVPSVRKDSGTSRWLRYGLFLSLSENDPGGDVAEGSDILKLLIGT